MIKRCISIMLIIFVSIYLGAAMPASATSIDYSPGILFIVDDLAVIDTAQLKSGEGSFTILAAADLKAENSRGYSAIAVDASLANSNKSLRKMLRATMDKGDVRIYLYGSLTIADYKTILGLDKFGANVDVLNQDGLADSKAYTYFSKEQENQTVENIISYLPTESGKNLLASIEPANMPASDTGFLAIILDDFCASQFTAMSTIVKSGFNYRSYYNTANYLNMDYILYRDTDEIDPTYDYFAIRTNFCAKNDSTLQTFNITAKHLLPFAADEMIDYGPGDITRAGSVSVGLDLSPGASISYSFEVGGGPTIDATYSAADDYSNWSITRYWFFGGYLQNELFALGSSWASTGTYAGTNVIYHSIFENSGGFPFLSTEKTVQIRYDY